MYLILLILSFISITSRPNAEQIAFDYFANEILSKKYHQISKVYFPGRSELEESIAGPFSQCFETDESFSKYFYQHKKTASEEVCIDFTAFPKFKKSVKSKANNLNLRVYRAVNNNDISYVYIKVYKEKHFVDHYLIKISLHDAAVVDVCRINETI